MKDKNDDKLKIFLAVSAAIHLLLLIIVFFGIPFKLRTPPDEKVIAFELLPAGSVNNVKTQKIQKKPTVENQDAKKIEKTNTSSSQPEEKKEEKHKTEQKKEAEVIPDKTKKVEKKEEKKSEKQDKKKEDPKTQKKKEDIKKKAPNNKDLDSLLKNLEDESDGNNPNSRKINRKKTNDTKDAFGNYNDSGPESLTNDEIIKQQIMKHWNQPVASTNESIIVVVELNLGLDGTVENSSIKSVSCGSGADILCQAVQDSVIRAINNASPLVNLLPEDYSSWKNIVINFNTKR